MKLQSILASLLLFPAIAFSTEDESNELPLRIVVKWNSPSDTLFLDELRDDPNLCCLYAFRTERSDTVTNIIESKDGTSLATICGKADPSLLLEMAPALQSLHADIINRRNRSKLNQLIKSATVSTE